MSGLAVPMQAPTSLIPDTCVRIIPIHVGSGIRHDAKRRRLNSLQGSLALNAAPAKPSAKRMTANCKACFNLAASLDRELYRRLDKGTLRSSAKQRRGDCRSKKTKKRCRSTLLGGQSAPR